MAELAEQLDAPQTSEPPAEPPRPSSDMDEAIAEFESATTADKADEEIAFNGNVDPLRALADEYSQENRLAGENAQLRDHILRESERADFGKFTTDIQSKLPAHLPEDYAETQLLAMAAKNPDLIAAWDLRNTDTRAAHLELTKIEFALAQLQNNPSADQSVVSALMQRGYQLGLALNAKEILRRASVDVVNRAEKFRPIDAEATAEYEAVAQAVRGAGGKVTAEPPPDFGRMSDSEFRNYTRDNFGYE